MFDNDPQSDDRTRVDPNDPTIAAFNASMQEMRDQDRIVMREMMQTYGRAMEFESFTTTVGAGQPIMLAGFDLSRMKMKLHAHGSGVYVGKRTQLAMGSQGYRLPAGSDVEFAQVGELYAQLTPDVNNITNYITNGGFESGTAGWLGSAQWVISQSQDRSTSGSSSLKITRQSATAGNGFTFIQVNGLTIGQPYYLSFDLWVSDPGALRITGTFVGKDFTPAVGMWKRYGFAFTANDVTGTFYLADDPNTAPVAGSTFYLDGVQINRGTTALPYADGNAVGNTWSGTPNNSATYASAPVPVSVWVEKSAQ